MTTEERDKCYKYDREKRNEILINALMIELVSKENIRFCNSANNTKLFFQNRFNSYLGNMLTEEKYKPSDFWFNDAGFQFKWRNFEEKIQLECITWDEVTRLLKQLM